MVMHLRIPAPWTEPGNKPIKCETVTITGDYDPFWGVEDGEEGGDLSQAVEFCNGTADGQECPTRDKCLIFALTNNIRTGVWGGTTPQTRRAIRKQWPLRRGKVPRPEWHWMTEDEAMDLPEVRQNGLPPEEEEDD